MTSWVQGRVVENRRWTTRIYSLHVAAEVAPFRAGQFTRLALDIGGERIARPYSFVNAPGERPLEFLFNTVPEGPLSNRLSGLGEGDPIWLAQRPVGYLTLQDVKEARHLWLFATGTAIGPFISILKTAECWQRFSKIILVHGVRTADELVYWNTLERMQEREPDRFTMVPCVTRETTSFAITDRIPVAIADGRLEARAGETLSPDNSQVMLCGNSAMIKDTQRLLELRGMKKNSRSSPGHISTENYW